MGCFRKCRATSISDRDAARSGILLTKTTYLHSAAMFGRSCHLVWSSSCFESTFALPRTDRELGFGFSKTSLT